MGLIFPPILFVKKLFFHATQKCNVTHELKMRGLHGCLLSELNVLNNISSIKNINVTQIIHYTTCLLKKIFLNVRQIRKFLIRELIIYKKNECINLKHVE